MAERIVWIEGIWCPLCWNEGPHQRVDVDPYGEYVVMRCCDDRCGAESRVAG